MSKMIISAAIRSVPLQGGLQESFTENYRVLERFDPQHKDWRAPEASAARPRGLEGEEDAAVEALKASDEARSEVQRDGRPKVWERPARGEQGGDDGEDYASAEDAWAPWTDEQWNGTKGVPWEEGDVGFLEDDGLYDDIDDDPLTADSLGVGLND